MPENADWPTLADLKPSAKRLATFEMESDTSSELAASSAWTRARSRSAAASVSAAPAAAASDASALLRVGSILAERTAAFKKK